jgi:hypothetical protein
MAFALEENLSGGVSGDGMCRALRAGMRQYGLFRYFDNVLPCRLGCGQVVDFRS